MRFMDGVKLGASFYVGWTVARLLSEVLDEHLRENKNVAKFINKFNTKNEDTEQPERIIGFHM